MDGFGREIEEKAKTEPGEAVVGDGSGDIRIAAVQERFIASGRTVYNNKGKPVLQYQRFFSSVPEYEDRKKIEPLLPQPSVIHYDPLLRETGIDAPKGKLPGTNVLGFFSTVEFNPWEEKHYDLNDTVVDSEYYKAFMKYMKDNPSPTESEKDEKDALEKAARFYNTPQIKVLDTLGRAFLDIENNLGEVLPEALRDIVSGTAVKPEELWNELKDKGYLEVRKAFQGGWVTSKFQPYTKGFVLELEDKYKQFKEPVKDLLRQNCLTSYHKFDISEREILSVDPRLYYANTAKQTEYYNFKHVYDMLGEEPLNTDSADAGNELHLSNIFSNLVWSWTARDFHQRVYYDRLQRTALVQVMKIKENGIIAADNAVEVFTYGEAQEQSGERNLRGQLYEHKDQSGVTVNSLYGLEGELLETSRQLTREYRQSIDWGSEVPLEPEIYRSKFTYNTLKHLVSEAAPDGAVTANTYNHNGLLDRVSVSYFDGSVQNVIDHIEYDANGMRTAITYSNGVKTTYIYEETTKHLLKLRSTRPGMSGTGSCRNSLLQDISCTYDPMGNITRMRDKSIQTVFNNNQKVEPLSDYTYDALYRIVRANGRQHTGINAASYINNHKSGDFKQSRFASPNDGEKLENYYEVYGYDEAGNLTRTSHKATNAWTREVEIQPGSNRLKTIIEKNGGLGIQEISYDRSGNQKQLYLNSAVELTWNCCENLVQACVIRRPDEEDDCDYYTYDGNELRTRRIYERMTGGGVISREEKIYLGNYEIKRIKSVDGSTEKTILERQTIKIMDDKACAAIIHYWRQDDQKREADKPGTRKIRYQTGNHLGSVSMELDGDAGLISYEEYFPYGGTAILAGDNRKEVELKEYRYSGKECDDSTGLYYYGARYYAPWLGRWMKPDPAGTVDGLNLYEFVGGDPINQVDHDGKVKRRQSKQKPEYNPAKKKFKNDQLEEPNSITIKHVTVKLEKWKDLNIIALKNSSVAFEHEYSYAGSIKSFTTGHTHGEFSQIAALKSPGYIIKKPNVSTSAIGEKARDYGEVLKDFGGKSPDYINAVTDAMRILKGTHMTKGLTSTDDNKRHAAIELAAIIGISEFARGGSAAIIDATINLYRVKHDLMKKSDFSNPKKGFTGAGKGGAEELRKLTTKTIILSMYKDILKNYYKNKTVQKTVNYNNFKEWREYKFIKWAKRCA